jgi:hypothetical protein
LSRPSFLVVSPLSSSTRVLALSSSSSRSMQRALASGGGSRITDYEPFLSVTSKRRQPSPIRSLQPLLELPGMVPLPTLYTQTSAHFDFPLFIY